jgi:hypothetical protein
MPSSSSNIVMRYIKPLKAEAPAAEFPVDPKGAEADEQQAKAQVEMAGAQPAGQVGLPTENYTPDFLSEPAAGFKPIKKAPTSSFPVLPPPTTSQHIFKNNPSDEVPSGTKWRSRLDDMQQRSSATSSKQRGKSASAARRHRASATSTSQERQHHPKRWLIGTLAVGLVAGGAATAHYVLDGNSHHERSALSNAGPNAASAEQTTTISSSKPETTTVYTTTTVSMAPIPEMKQDDREASQLQALIAQEHAKNAGRIVITWPPRPLSEPWEAHDTEIHRPAQSETSTSSGFPSAATSSSSGNTTVKQAGHSSSNGTGGAGVASGSGSGGVSLTPGQEKIAKSLKPHPESAY